MGTNTRADTRANVKANDRDNVGPNSEAGYRVSMGAGDRAGSYFLLASVWSNDKSLLLSLLTFFYYISYYI